MRVLVIEDCESNAEILAELVKSSGHEVRVAYDGESGLEQARLYCPHVVFTDYRMPGMDGLEVCQRLRQMNRYAHVVMVTAFGSEKVALDALHHGASNYLTKPINPDYLMYMLGKYDENVQSQEDLRRVNQCICRISTDIEMPCNPRLVAPVVDRILREVEDQWPQADINGLHLGLEEILRNAIEHGNLEIGMETKTIALREFRLTELIEERMEEPKLAERTVKIHYEIEDGCMTCVIEDEGPGFDYEHLPDPLSEDGLERLNGRGIFLTRAFFDEVNYQGRGNRVELVKHLAVDPSLDAIPTG
ncbi:response regulator [bacterium]|nr:response regulator [bacterium]